MPIRWLQQIPSGLPDIADIPSGALPPRELRFILEYEEEPQLATERARLAETLGSDRFVRSRMLFSRWMERGEFSQDVRAFSS